VLLGRQELLNDLEAILTAVTGGQAAGVLGFVIELLGTLPIPFAETLAVALEALVVYLEAEDDEEVVVPNLSGTAPTPEEPPPLPPIADPVDIPIDPAAISIKTIIQLLTGIEEDAVVRAGFIDTVLNVFAEREVPGIFNRVDLAAARSGLGHLQSLELGISQSRGLLIALTRSIEG